MHKNMQQKKFSKRSDRRSASFLVILSMRHRADYDPKSRFSIIETVNAIDLVEGAIRKLMNADANDRMAFISFLAFPHRKD